MHIPACVAIASLITTSYALTRGRLGFVLSVKNPDKTCKLQSDYELDLSTIRSNTGATIVRTYSASDCNSTRELLPAAQAKRFQVVLGVWPDSERTFQADKLALVEHATRYPAQVHAVTVGSETLNRGNLTGPELLSKINEVKAIVPGTKVGTADRWNKFADGSADALIRGGVELLMVSTEEPT
jgi:glucan 1,3-beta-glucosidase